MADNEALEVTCGTNRTFATRAWSISTMAIHCQTCDKQNIRVFDLNTRTPPNAQTMQLRLQKTTTSGWFSCFWHTDIEDPHSFLYASENVKQLPRRCEKCNQRAHCLRRSNHADTCSLPSVLFVARNVQVVPPPLSSCH